MDVASPLEAWANFYIIVGSSAGALTGLQFVVMTLVAERVPASSRGDSVSAFGTPNVVHFCAALLVARSSASHGTSRDPQALRSPGAAGSASSTLQSS